jgi:hypothetical protein
VYDFIPTAGEDPIVQGDYTVTVDKDVYLKFKPVPAK